MTLCFQHPSAATVIAELGGLDAYLHQMSQPGNWGDEICLLAAATVLSLRIFVHIFNVAGNNLTRQVFSPAIDKECGSHIVFVGNIDQHHFAALEITGKNIDKQQISLIV